MSSSWERSAGGGVSTATGGLVTGGDAAGGNDTTDFVGLLLVDLVVDALVGLLLDDGEDTRGSPRVGVRVVRFGGRF